MSTTKHTQGPWRMIGKIKGQEVYSWIFGKDQSVGIERELQVISMQDSHPIKEHLERRFADMKLMTAAPELLEALESCAEALNILAIKLGIHAEGSPIKHDNPDDHGVINALTIAKQVIKKATE